MRYGTSSILNQRTQLDPADPALRFFRKPTNGIYVLVRGHHSYGKYLIHLATSAIQSIHQGSSSVFKHTFCVPSSQP